MALATLCSQLRQSQEGSGLSFTAFIVDHGLRQGSDEEALTVAKNLKQLGRFQQFKNTQVTFVTKIWQTCLPGSSLLTPSSTVMPTPQEKSKAWRADSGTELWDKSATEEALRN